MSIYKSSINSPITTALIFVAVMILGVFSYMRLPIDQFPEMEPPYISVMTTYAGANSSEIETNVSKLLENSLNSVEGLKEITSTSKDNLSLVTLEFEWGYDLDEAVNDIRSSIDMIYDNLPDGVSRPLIFKFNTSSMPIMQYAITADKSYPGLEKILEDQVINVLNRIDGIGNLSLGGAPKRYVYIDLDPQKLDAYGLSVEQVGNAVSTNNLNLASGSVKMGKEQYQLRVQSEYVESSEINNIVVTTSNTGKQVYVRDLAEVRDTIKDITLDEKINGRDGVRLIVMKQSGANTVQIARDVRKELTRIQKTLPPDIKIQNIYDSSTEIQNAINGLIESVGYALLFVVLVVLFFLGKWRAALIISVTIPISLLVAFIYLLLTDSSLNIISLCSLNVAIGMVVDDAIVVLENITKHIERGSNPREASIYATNEVWVSVIATTLVIVAVFVPLTMIGGQAGILFKELGWIVTIVCSVSTLVAITLTPMLCSKLLKARKVKVDENGHLIKEEQHKGWYQKYVVGFLDKVDYVYANALRWCLNHKIITIIGILLFFGVSLIPALTGKIGTDFMAQQDNGRMSVTIELQRGTRVEESIKMARFLEQKIMEVAPEVILISTSVGSDDEGGISALFTSSTNNKISMTIRCPKKWERKRTIWQIAESIREVLNQSPEVINYTVSTASGMGGGSSNNVAVEIYGYDFNTTNLLAENLKNKFKDIAGARDIDIDREEDRAELQIIFDKEKLARHGLSTSAVSMYVRNRVNGFTAGFLKEDGEEYDIIVRLAEKYRDSMTDIKDFTLVDAMGQRVKLNELAKVEEYWCPPEIKRKSRQRIVTVSVTPEGVSLGELATSIQEVISQTEIPQGVNVVVGGTYEDQQETFADMGMLLALIVLLVYIVMASQFEDFMKPLIIMSSAVMAIPGVIWALFITGVSLDMIGALGVVLLIGIVVKNGIVLVDYTNLMRERGYELNEAIALSGQSRLRPVLMTAFTTILGMVPMAFSQSEGSEMWQPLGIVVIGGLLISTLVTLIIVPILYAITSRHGDRDKEAENRKNFIFMQINENDEPEDSTNTINQ
ncbi:MAG: efflux RND transporter permease subunit [Paludibacteraceae bacterium]|nr:efflux RND transporter permease subunit [Paludibacteraceae bacterium]